MQKKRGYSSHIKIAILIDGDYFLKRYRLIYGKNNFQHPEIIAKYLYTMVHKHVEGEFIYRILYYDCLPYDKKAHNPISGKAIDFSKTQLAIFRNEYFECLKKQRKVALRIGYLKDRVDFNWMIYPRKLKELLKKEISIDDLQEDDVYPTLRQKGVDIRIGLDIASLAYKRLVNRIILISGDSDFVPAAKVARREGIDFILDPMWNHIDSSLFEHIDGLKSTCKRPTPSKAK